MQPVVGVISDSCKSKWGRRRPFLVGGSVIVIASLLAIGWTRELTTLFTRTESGDTVKFYYRILYIYIFLISLYQYSLKPFQ
jgi:solute carrier family 45 protein 1/2/4